jgi:ribosome-associated translation inhibitor RaiA
MQIQVHTDNHIEGSAGLTNHVQEVVEDALERFAGQITRVVVHLSDESSAAKSVGDDKRCRIEVRLAGMQPLSVSFDSGEVGQSLRGAARKMEAMLSKTIGKLESR